MVLLPSHPGRVAGNHGFGRARFVVAMNIEVDSALVDGAVIQVSSPIVAGRDCVPFTSTEPVSIRVINLGASTLLAGTALFVSYVVDG